MTATASTAEILSRENIAGVTLIEILVTLVVNAIGLLALGALQMRAPLAGMEAYNRAHALVMLDVRRFVRGCAGL